MTERKRKVIEWLLSLPKEPVKWQQRRELKLEPHRTQVLRLLRGLRDDVGCSVVMITHDLGVVADGAVRTDVHRPDQFRRRADPGAVRDPDPGRPLQAAEHQPTDLVVEHRPLRLQ